MSKRSYEQALQDFRRARQEAALRQLLQRFSRKSNQLLAYHDLSDKLKITDTVEHGLREIPLTAIVGSVGRADDFTRDFLPKRDSDAERWAAVRAAVMDMKGWTPIEVYQVGDAYFVKDGNHRVSVARQLGNETIAAYVTEVETRLSLEAGEEPEDIISRANYVDFLDRTRLDVSRPDADLHLTFCNHYTTLLAQIEHRRQSAKGGSEMLSVPDAAASWYDEVYLPTVKLIRRRGVMRNFQEHTEADIYILLSERREELEEALGWEVKSESAVAEWAAALSSTQSPLIARMGSGILKRVAPALLEDGPPPGDWRRRRITAPSVDSLFADILVSLQGTEADWRLLDNTLLVAQREEAAVLAIHAVSNKDELQSEETALIHEEFLRRCEAAGIAGQFAAEVGVEGKLLIERAAWADLVTTNLTFATEAKPLSQLSSGVNALLQRCPRPILVMAGETDSPMNRALLGYDGSPKADEALFVAAYLAARWQIELTVLTVVTEHTKPETIDRARRYLIGNQLVNVTYVLREEPITDAVVQTASEQDSNLLVIGGYGYRPMRHFVLGSTVDAALARCRIPILICR